MCAICVSVGACVGVLFVLGLVSVCVCVLFVLGLCLCGCAICVRVVSVWVSYLC